MILPNFGSESKYKLKGIVSCYQKRKKEKRKKEKKEKKRKKRKK